MSEPRTPGGFDQAAFEHLPGAEEKSFWFRSRNELILWALGRYFAGARSMLEVGCGTGFVLAGVRRAHPEMRLVGAELFEAGLEVAAGRVPDAEFHQVDARDVSFRDEFDVVGAFDVLEHIAEDELALRRMRDALRPGGGLLVTAPQHPSLWSAVDEYSQHVRRYGRRDLLTKIRGAGFEVVRWTSFVSLLFPLMIASRMRLRRQEAFDPLTEYRAMPFIDSALGWVMGIERVLIRLGVSLPAGGSLLVVARRSSMS